MFEITMMPARQGDCLWIEYGDENQPSIILIDGGMRETAAAIREQVLLRKKDEQDLHIELLVVTHIDIDHINGIIELLKDPDFPVTFGDIWFNGRPQMEQAYSDILGINQGDELSTLLEAWSLPWNEEFSGAPIYLNGEGDVHLTTLPGGMNCYVIGPPAGQLKRLADDWLDIIDGVEPSDNEPDDILGRDDTWPAEWKDSSKKDGSVTNASSISLALEYEGRWALLPGDAFADDILDGVNSLAETTGTEIPEFSVFKLSHHCSVKNISEELIQSVPADQYLISTDGTTHKHPDNQALLRLIKWSGRRPYFAFNYSIEKTRWWLENKDALPMEYQQYDAEGPYLESNGWLTVKV